MSDKRMTDGPSGRVSRGRKSGGTIRAQRARPTGHAHARELTDRERLELWQSQFHQSVLPDLPKIPGYHVCWLTTQNPRDSIQMRMRLGYTPVTAEDIPGYDHATTKTGDYAGMVCINEMVAFKLPLSLYQTYLTESHHNAPAREEQKLADTANSIRENAQRIGANIAVGSGTANLGKYNPASPFGDMSE